MTNSSAHTMKALCTGLLLCTLLVVCSAPAAAGVIVGGELFGGGEMGRVDGGTHVTALGGDTIFGNIYGGGEKAQVDTTHVTLLGGAFGGDVFGGGKGFVSDDHDLGKNIYANVMTETFVEISGSARAQWSSYFDDATNTIIPLSASTKSYFYETIDGQLTFRRAHNIYGGGYLASHVEHNTHVVMRTGIFEQDILMSEEWKDAYDDNQHPHFHVFGGGYGANTSVDSTFVTIDIASTGNNNPGTTTGQMAPAKRASGLEDHINMGIVSDKFGTPGNTVLGVIGGGYDGFVLGSTEVNIYQNPNIHRVHGGGLGSLQGYQDWHTALNDSLGTVYGNTFVNAKGGQIQGNIFGGGAGVESYIHLGDTTDFTNMARVLGSTHVLLDSGRVGSKVYTPSVYGTVYGGGDIANTDNATYITINDGNVYENVFGGGNGRENLKVKDYTLLGGAWDSTVVVLNGGTVWQDIYGGGAFGQVQNNTHITLYGGQIGNNIFGGGLGKISGDTITSANIGGHTYVTIEGGSYIWNKISDKEGNVLSYQDRTVPYTAIEQAKTNPMALAPYLAGISDFFDVAHRRYTRDHNIYGGGNLACRVEGDTHVDIYHGLLTDSLGYGDATVWKRASLLRYMILDNISQPQFAVLGGGYGPHTSVSNTFVNLQIGKENALGTGIQYKDYTKDTEYWDRYRATITDGFSALSTSEKDQKYGGNDALTENRYLMSRMCWNFGVENHTYLYVVGGGLAGQVEQDTHVDMGNHTGVLGIFGGGIGMMPTDEITDGSIYTYGRVGGSTFVNVDGGVVSRNIYGGGAGIESINQGGNLIDFTNMARVLGKTHVTIGGDYIKTFIYGKVFGGGDVANVGPSAEAVTTNMVFTDFSDDSYRSEVNIVGGTLFQQVFAGGRGRLVDQCNDYQQLGAIYGNTHLMVEHRTSSMDTIPVLWNRIYGGAENGKVYGNTLIDIAGGQIGHNIYGGGWGDVRMSNETDTLLTSADVACNTNIHITGGTYILTQMWDPELRTWNPAVKMNGKTYSPQYDPTKQIFNVNHNTYGGGNIASLIGGNTHVLIEHGMLDSNSILGNDDEWKAIYSKKGTTNFTVFGGGYGENAIVEHDSYIDLRMTGPKKPGSTSLTGHKAFFPDQSLMDVYGGGFAGEVKDSTHVTLDGDNFIRRVYGGGFRARVGQSRVNILSANLDDAFAGGMMGDVQGIACVTAGSSNIAKNKNVRVMHDIYGGNDVSGYIGAYSNAMDMVNPGWSKYGAEVNLFGGHVLGNVYGAGNGNYRYYMLPGIDVVTPVEDAVIEQGGASVTYPGTSYAVPMRADLGSLSNATEAQKLVNINIHRPAVSKTTMRIGGFDGDTVLVDGRVFGGGNSATLRDIQLYDGSVLRAQDTIHIGNNIMLGGIFLGSDGEALFINSSANTFMTDFQNMNNISLADSIDWNNVKNRTISQTFLPGTHEERIEIFPHLLDLYFEPVEMGLLPSCLFSGQQGCYFTDDNLLNLENENANVNVFCCGGNRGNMAVFDPVTIALPPGLTVHTSVIGGCYQANYILNQGMPTETHHTGGFLLGQGDKLYLTIMNKFMPTVDPTDPSRYAMSSNVYGGCYESGNINGNVTVDIRTNMLRLGTSGELDAAKLAKSNASDIPVCNVYGAGYGMYSYVYGNTTLLLGNNDPAKANLHLSDGSSASVLDPQKASVNNMFGGAQKGFLIGNSTLHVLNGTVLNDVVGGCYSSYQFGSTAILVGYPEYYTATKSDSVILHRADPSADNLAREHMGGKMNGEKVIRQHIKLLKGDIISKSLYDEVDEAQKANFKPSLTVEQRMDSFLTNHNWDSVHINIGNAIYGGGYSVSTGTVVIAGNNTVIAYDEQYNNDNHTMLFEETDENKSMVGYGGNATVIVWDHNDGYITMPDGWKEGDPAPAGYDMEDHISISKMGSGGIYGDGHLSFVERFRSAEVKRYGYNGRPLNDAKELNVIHRFDLARLEDCCIALDGARDYATSATDMTLYALSRIGELQLYSSIPQDTKLPSTHDEYIYTEVIKSLVDGSDSIKVRRAENTYNRRRARNYFGIRNNVHYVGAIKTNTEFDGVQKYWHDANGNLGSGSGVIPRNGAYDEMTGKNQYRAEDFTGGPGDHGPVSYEEHKLEYVQEFFPRDTLHDYLQKFRERNNGTAVNMIGIASGYSLKLQNYADTLREGVDLGGSPIVNVVESPFYGPIVGVAEVNLINVQPGEGGGYVYADNIHAPDPNKTFLQKIGNFVFPIDSAAILANRYIVDDCFPHGYGTGKHGEAKDYSEGHYWYVTGHIYKYYVTLTGVTFDSKAFGGIGFEVDNTMQLINFAGADSASVIKLEQFSRYKSVDPFVTESYNHHSADFDCDLDPATGDVGHHGLLNDGYVLKFAAINNNDGYMQDTIALGVGGAPDSVNYMVMHPEYYNNDGTHRKDSIEQFLVSPGMSPYIAIQLWDSVDNNGMIGESDTTYYARHLQENDTLSLKFTMEDPNSAADKFEYYIRLVIAYVEGPHYIGGIDVLNCALPGEMIELSADNLKILGDQSMTPNQYVWNIGHRDAGLIVNDNEKLSYNVLEDVGRSPMLKEHGAYVDQTSGHFFVPAYYFMDGYYVQYNFKVYGFDQTFPVAIRDTDILEVHNYHRMKQYNHPTQENLAHLSAGARIYLRDQDDLKAFFTYVNTTPDDTVRTQHFILQNDIVMPAGCEALKKKFCGTLSGDGYHITLAPGKTSLFGDSLATDGHVYNLGLLGGTITTLPGNAVCDEIGSDSLGIIYGTHVTNSYEINATTINNKYMRESREKGRMAYQLSHYFCDSVDTNDYVHQYFANGDYRYARQRAEGQEYYLRTAETPNYNSHLTFHDTQHPVDSLRWVEDSLRHIPLYDGRDNAYNNDYLFFGQHIDKMHKDTIPFHINPIASGDATKDLGGNRVYETPGFYRSKLNERYWYNQDAWAITDTLTAIDFAHRVAEGDSAQGIPLRFTKDTPVSQNLLVYSHLADNSSSVFSTGIYNTNKAADDVVYHTISSDSIIRNIHLVDHEDFNAPIAFHVTNQAWYDRMPDDYAMINSKNWEGITLPFPVNRVRASYNGELSHFYGVNPSGQGANKVDTTNVGHEYWLRGFTEVHTGSIEDTAFFQRPGIFDLGKARSDYYRYSNSHFLDVYGETVYGYGDIYDTTRTYKDYEHQDGSLPYLIAFPGKDYKEFDLSGEYNSWLMSTHNEEQVPSAHPDWSGLNTEQQSVEFAYVVDRGTTVEGFRAPNVDEHGILTVPVSDDSTLTVTRDGYRHIGTYMNYPAHTATKVGAFRTWFSNSLGQPVAMHIAGSNSYTDEEQQPAEPTIEEQQKELRIWSCEAQYICVYTSEAADLPMYNSSGQMMFVIHAPEGLSRYYVPCPPGVYIVGQTKVML